jgi:hypothetical protein
MLGYLPVSPDWGDPNGWGSVNLVSFIQVVHPSQSQFCLVMHCPSSVAVLYICHVCRTRRAYFVTPCIFSETVFYPDFCQNGAKTKSMKSAVTPELIYLKCSSMWTDSTHCQPSFCLLNAQYGHLGVWPEKYSNFFLAEWLECQGWIKDLGKLQRGWGTPGASH